MPGLNVESLIPSTEKYKWMIGWIKTFLKENAINIYNLARQFNADLISLDMESRPSTKFLRIFDFNTTELPNPIKYPC